MSRVATRPLTIAELAEKHRERRWDLIDGEPVEVTSSAGLSSMIASRISGELSVYLREHPIGHAFSADAGFILFQDRATLRSPDFAFVSHTRLSKMPETSVPIVPDLAVEVLSPSDRWADILARSAMYLQGGVRLVWVIDPANRTATIFWQEALPATLKEDGLLDGEVILPGFSLPLARLFA